MNHYPLFFTYRDRIFGNGFLADVVSHGRVLGSEEDGELWAYGVEPGGLAASGVTPRAALKEFRNTFRNVLFDLAAEAPSFDAFRAAVNAFFHEVNESVEEDWKKAVEAVRAREIDLKDMPRQDADTVCYINVELSEQASFSPKDNQPAKLEPALAA